MSATIECPVCGGDIEAGTDDNYNSEHSEIQCPHCSTWFAMTRFEYTLEGGRA